MKWIPILLLAFILPSCGWREVRFNAAEPGKNASPRVRVLAESRSGDAYAEWIEQGDQAALNGEWQDAGRSWQKAADLQPNRLEAVANLGVLHERAGALVQARDEYRTAVKGLGKRYEDYAKQIERLLEGK